MPLQHKFIYKNYLTILYQKIFGNVENFSVTKGGRGVKMYYEEDYEDEEDIYKKAMRSLLLEDDEINPEEEAFMEGYEGESED